MQVLMALVMSFNLVLLSQHLVKVAENHPNPSVRGSDK